MAKVVLEFVFKNHKRSQEFFFGLKKGDNGFSIKDCGSSRTYDAIYNTLLHWFDLMCNSVPS